MNNHESMGDIRNLGLSALTILGCEVDHGKVKISKRYIQESEGPGVFMWAVSWLHITEKLCRLERVVALIVVLHEGWVKCSS